MATAESENGREKAHATAGALTALEPTDALTLATDMDASAGSRDTRERSSGEERDVAVAAAEAGLAPARALVLAKRALTARTLAAVVEGVAVVSGLASDASAVASAGTAEVRARTGSGTTVTTVCRDAAATEDTAVTETEAVARGRREARGARDVSSARGGWVSAVRRSAARKSRDDFIMGQCKLHNVAVATMRC